MTETPSKPHILIVIIDAASLETTKTNIPFGIAVMARLLVFGDKEGMRRADGSYRYMKTVKPLNPRDCPDVKPGKLPDGQAQVKMLGWGESRASS